MYVEQPWEPWSKGMARSIPRKTRHAPSGVHTLQAFRVAAKPRGGSSTNGSGCMRALPGTRLCPHGKLHWIARPGATAAQSRATVVQEQWGGILAVGRTARRG